MRWAVPAETRRRLARLCATCSVVLSASLYGCTGDSKEAADTTSYTSSGSSSATAGSPPASSDSERGSGNPTHKPGGGGPEPPGRTGARTAELVDGPPARKFQNQPPGEEGWQFVAAGRTDPYNWEVWIEPDPFGEGRRCERFKYGEGSRAEAGSGSCCYELPLDFSGPSKASWTPHSTVKGVVSNAAVRVWPS